MVDKWIWTKLSTIKFAANDSCCTRYQQANVASRSLHPYQPRAWLRHAHYLRMAQTLKSRCRCVQYARTRFLLFKPLFQIFRRPQTKTLNVV